MARPYTHVGHNGYAFLGNRMHPEDIHWINAQLDSFSCYPAKAIRLEAEVRAHMLTPAEQPLGEQNSVRMEYLYDARLSLLQTLGELALEESAA